jgi:hypothetical protein
MTQEFLLQLFPAIPALALLIFSTFKISLIPALNRGAAKFEFWVHLLFGILFFSIYNFTVMFLLSSKDLPLIKIAIMELALLGIGVAAFLIIRFLLKRQCEKEKLRSQQEKVSLQTVLSIRLIEAVSSELREFRNRLQVMNMFAEMGKNVEISIYIRSVADQVIETIKVEKIENPIILAVIISRKILGKEKGVETVVYMIISHPWYHRYTVGYH